MPRCTAPLPAMIRRSSPISIITDSAVAAPPPRAALRRLPCRSRLRPSPRPRRARGDRPMTRQPSDTVMVSGQIAPHEVAGLVEQGVTVLINNRPDGEEPDQPRASDIEDAAAVAGIDYRF